MNWFEKRILFTLKDAFCLIACFFLLVSYLESKAQSKNANNWVPPYTTEFLYGVNSGWYGNNWDDVKVAQLAAKVGAGTYRLGLNDKFIQQWGVLIRDKEFSIYTDKLKLRDNAVFLNEASDAHLDRRLYPAPGFHLHKPLPALVFDHLYDPIWLGDGKVNPQNYYAAYVYNLVKVYGNRITFWEVWNEPDIFSGNDGFLKKGQWGNWFENEPNPQVMYNLRAPIFYYIRMLRITYEIVKKQYPNSYVTTGGIGFPSFLSCCLRYTDNPDHGKISPDFPFTGGAYFDVLSFHNYPLYAAHYSDNFFSGMKYKRYSDACMEIYGQGIEDFRKVLLDYGYGKKYPQKYLICTETNISSNPINPNPGIIGSPQEQRNYLMKMFTLGQKLDVKQIYVFSLASGIDEGGIIDVNNYMGLYKPLREIHPGEEELTEEGIAFKTMSLLLKGFHFDPVRTSELQMNDKMDGAAFKKDGIFRYILWAKTYRDLSENSACIYKFPSFFRGKIQVYHWDASRKGFEYHFHYGNKIIVTGDPIILKVNE